MTLVKTSRGVINTNVNTAVQSFGAFTPAANALLEVVADINGISSQAEIRDNQGLTWTNRFVDGTFTVHVWTAQAPSSVASTTITVSGAGATGWLAEVVETPSAQFKQFQTNSGSAGVLPQVTMDTAFASVNAGYGALFNITNPATVAPPTGWVESQDVGHTLPPAGMETCIRNSGETLQTLSFGTSASLWTIVMLESQGSAAAVLAAARRTLALMGVGA